MPFEPVEIQDPVIRCYLALNGPRYLLFDRDNASDDVFWALAPDLGTYTLDTPGYVIWDRWDLSRDTRALQPDDLILDVSEIEALEDGGWVARARDDRAVLTATLGASAVLARVVLGVEGLLGDVCLDDVHLPISSLALADLLVADYNPNKAMISNLLIAASVICILLINFAIA